MLTTVTGPLLGGIGIFFVGAYMVSQNLKNMTSRRLRQLFARFTRRDLQSAAIGFMSGLITQSTSVSTFIMGGLSASGLVRVRNALPVVFWANAGCSLLVAISVIDIRYLVFLLLFVSGVCMAFEKPASLRFPVRALFGIGLLFLGLQFIQQGAAPLTGMPWVRKLLVSSHGSIILAFFLGTGLTVVTQTYIGVVIIAVTMVKAGVFSLEQVMMLTYGAELGSSVVTLLLSSGIRGTAKQLIMSQVFFNYMSVGVMVALFYLEYCTGIPLVKALIKSLSSDPDKEIVCLVIFYNFAIPMLSFFCYDWIYALLNRFWPPTREEMLAKIKFIKDHSLDDPAAALMMVEKELLRLVRRFPEYPAAVKKSLNRGGKEEVDGITHYHTAFVDINREIAYTLSDIAKLELDSDSSTELLKLFNIQELIVTLEQNLADLAPMVELSMRTESLKQFYLLLLESLEFLLLQAVDALAGDDRRDLEILRALTAVNSEAVKQVRSRYLEIGQNLDLQDKATLYKLSGLFERTVWLLNRLSESVELGLEKIATVHP
ncbi:phosphate:Na+ symporter [Desulfonauticus submarinus]|uniref:Phosphate:Na+ symporter n=1 Tax=Desulfonauticus submarinus TaxID=206665 RepID=A0A1H0EE72_9BACT|nr:Na/Pi symporter [Desulfonauticus submarinus]SDN80643.1 phosphate:Na+ symporter [Desulfonauticus submarinus]